MHGSSAIRKLDMVTATLRCNAHPELLDRQYIYRYTQFWEAMPIATWLV